MALIIKSSTLNQEKTGHEEEWVEYQPGVEFLIRGMGHRFVQIGIQAHSEAQEKIRNRFLAGDVSALAQGKTMVELNTAVLGALVIGGWKGVVLESGESLEYSPETATAIVGDPDNSKLVEWLITEATRITKDAHEALEKRMGKPSSDSSGKKKPEPKKATPGKNPDETR